MAETWPYGDCSQPSPGDKRRKVYRSSFDSVDAMRKVKPSALNEQRYQMSQRDNRGADWWGVEGDTKAVDKVIDEGWPEGVARLSQMADSLTIPPAVSIKRRRARGDQGDELDIHRVYRGQLDTAWSRRQRKVARAPRHIDLLAITSANCHVKAEAMFWRGAAITRLADLLDEAGYRVRIRGAEIGTGVDARGKFDQVTDWVIKDYDEPLTLTNVAASACLAGFFRRVGFASICSILEEVNYGFGRSVHDGPLVDTYFGDCIMVPETVRDAASASAWVVEQVGKIEAGEILQAAA